MPDKEDTKRALEILRDDLEALNCDIEEEFTREVEEQTIRGLNCVRDRFGFQVITVVDSETPFFEVRYVFNAKQIVARELKKRSEGSGEDVELESEGDQDYLEQAKKKLVGLRRSEFEKVHKGLIERLTSTSTFYNIFTIEEYGIQGFQVQKKVFPLKDFYNISGLEDAICAVTSKGELGGVFLTHSYELEDFIENQFDSGDEDEESELGYIG